MSEDDDIEQVPSAPLEEKLIKEAPIKVKTAEDLEKEAEKDAVNKKFIYIKPIGKFTKTEASFYVSGESHGFCNALKDYLLKNPEVLFASYKKEFGVDPSFYVNTSGNISALEALVDATERMNVDLADLLKQMTDSVAEFA
jgi:DNA-directed RNA polymerase subunit L